MNLHELYPFPEERKQRKRLGRGTATGQGSTSGKGHKGQNARSGGGVPVWFEGGQMPLQRRLPKWGFKNPFRVAYQALNVGQLLSLFPDQEEITLEDLYAKGVAVRTQPIKILGQGDIAKAVKVTAHKFSKQAAEKITQAGGQATAVEG